MSSKQSFWFHIYLWEGFCRHVIINSFLEIVLRSLLSLILKPIAFIDKCPWIFFVVFVKRNLITYKIEKIELVGREEDRISLTESYIQQKT